MVGAENRTRHREHVTTRLGNILIFSLYPGYYVHWVLFSAFHEEKYYGKNIHKKQLVLSDCQRVGFEIVV